MFWMWLQTRVAFLFQQSRMKKEGKQKLKSHLSSHHSAPSRSPVWHKHSSLWACLTVNLAKKTKITKSRFVIFLTLKAGYCIQLSRLSRTLFFSTYRHSCVTVWRQNSAEWVLVISSLYGPGFRKSGNTLKRAKSEGRDCISVKRAKKPKWTHLTLDFGFESFKDNSSSCSALRGEEEEGAEELLLKSRFCL